ncbi:putative DUF81-family integral membrane protein [Octadecabacter antarcticus 307]|uniref:Probable membrane transporter protein n=1 Tax=Octadecabacter antarcticus 307 TaxID=391626 RepID=M9RBK5_9RHOB|nr:sulfite exporter TauE/SafE family protein [Octadecabacter antarcticus]AGI69552.1 putative DUF81-family integral membrane protein [Octadecabacter antarcticus 307]
MDGTLFWSLAVVAAVCTGLSKGGLPAFSMLAVPVLSLVISPVTAAGLLLPVFLFSDIFGVWAYRHQFRRDLLKIAAVGTIFGCSIGWATAEIVSENLVRVLIGVIGALFALNFLLRHRADAAPRAPTWARGVFWTTIAGFTSFVSHAGAPPWQIWTMPMGLTKLAFAGTTTIVFAMMNLTKVVPYYFLGQFDPQNLRVAAMLLAPAVIGVYVGYRLIRVLPDKVFFGIVTWALLAISCKLIWDGVLG